MRSAADHALLDQNYGDHPRFPEAFSPPRDETSMLPECAPAPAALAPLETGETEDARRGACRHILTDGRRCGSPALRRQSFCYYHHTTRKPAPHPALLRRSSTLELPRMEDRSAVQYSISEVLRAIAEDAIDPRRASLLLYGLQIASNNLPREDPKAVREETVEEIVLDPEQGILAPPAEYQNTKREKTLEEILVAQWEQEKLYQKEDEEKALKRRMEQEV